MKTSPICCHGWELESVLKEIRERGGSVTALHTGVGGNAGYRVSYFERVVKAVPSTDSRTTGEMRDGDDGGPRPALNNVLGSTEMICEVTGESQRGMTNGRNPTGNSEPVQFPHQGETPASLLATVAVKRVVAPRNPVSDAKIPCYASDTAQIGLGAETVGVVPFSDAALKSDGGKCHNDTAQKRIATGDSAHVPVNAWPSARETSASPSLPHCPACSGPVTQGMPCPICAGLERIKNASRRIRKLFRPSTKEARIPYAD